MASGAPSAVAVGELRLKTLWQSWKTIGLLVLILAFFREPLFLLSPRIWAEEGSLYLQDYLDKGLLDSLLSPQLGYYSLYNNLVIATSTQFLGLELVAVGTTLIAFAVMLFAILAPFYLASAYWSDGRVRFLLAFFSLIIGSAEIWLNTINVQFYLGLFASCLLLSNQRDLNAKLYWLTVAVLGIGALSGVTSVILLPFFLWKLRQVRRSGACLEVQRLQIYVFILGFGLVVQTVALMMGFSVEADRRFSTASIDNLPLGLARTWLYLFSGSSSAVSAFFGAVIGLLGLYSVWTLARARYLAIMVVYIGLVFTVLSVGMQGGGRYAYMPSVLVMLILLNGWSSMPSQVRGRVTIAVILLFAVYKLEFFFDTDRFYDHQWSRYADEIREIEAGTSTSIRLFPQWPETDWKVDIPSQHISRVRK